MPVEKFKGHEVFAGTLTVLVLAVIGYLASGNVRIAVAVLLVACPCAFAIATPSAVAAGIANMARRAVLIKGGIFFEIAAKINP
jgi:cation transport ATPase